MIDNPANRFLDSTHFVARNRPFSPPSCLFGAVVLVWLSSCSPQPEPDTVEDSITSGRITVVCAPEAFDVIARARVAFDSLYPKAKIDLVKGSSRDAVTALFGARADMAIITRELEPEEREAAVRGGLDLEGYRFARDAIRIVVHPDNPVENLSIDDLRDVLRGTTRSWIGFGGGDIEPVAVVQPLEADVTQFFLQEVMAGEPIALRAIQTDSDSAAAAAVRREPRSVGYATMTASVEGLRVLRMAALRGLPYWKPDPEAIHRGDYPLTRYYNMYVRTGDSKLASGFVTYVTNIDGQRLVRDAGLVPTSVPVRFVRRSPLLGSH